VPVTIAVWAKRVLERIHKQKTKLADVACKKRFEMSILKGLDSLQM
jgi:hypothetical protein